MCVYIYIYDVYILYIYSNKYVMVSHHGFNLHYQMVSDVEHLTLSSLLKLWVSCCLKNLL